MDFRQRKAIENKYKTQLLNVNPKLNDQSGIYFLTRTDEEGFKYAYIGQAKHILQRLVGHFFGYQHIDVSLKKHKLHTTDNPYGWSVNFLNFPEDRLDEMEQKYIKEYASAGYQLRNKTSGSQGEGKRQIDEYKPSKGYRDGIDQGYKNASRDIAHLFDLHLEVKTKKNPPTVNQEKALEKFNNFLNYYKEGKNEG